MEECFVEGCKRIPAFECNCSENMYMCIDHNGRHMLNEGIHTLTRISFLPTNSSIDSYLKKYKEIMASYNLIIKNTREFCFSVIQNLNASAEKVLKEINQLKCFIKGVMKNLLLKTEFRYSEMVQFDSISIQDLSSRELNSKFINKSLKQCFNETIEALTRFKNSDEYAFTFLDPKTKNLRQINLENFQRYLIEFKTDDFEHGSACCRIGDNMYFLYGGSKYPKIPFILNVKTDEIKRLNNNVPITSAGVCLYEKKIYIFGGSEPNNITSSKSYRFNLEKNEWTSISPLSQKSGYTTCSSFSSRIVIVGLNINSVLEYDRRKNRYYDFSKLEAEGERYIFHNFVVAEKNFLYEIEDKKLIVREEIKFAIGKLNIYGSFQRRGFIYFVNFDRQLFRISTTAKNVERINYLVFLIILIIDVYSLE